MRSSAAPVGVTRSMGGPAAYTGASPSSDKVAGAGTGRVPCWHFTVPLPTFNGEANHPSTCSASHPAAAHTISIIVSTAPTS